jgi:fermentation-respiration switch protein FrsA (DUF1100 family)
MGILLAVVALLLTGYLLVSVFYWIFQERFIFVALPLGPRARFRFRHGVPFTERWLERPDGGRPHALYFRADAPRGVVLYFHGNTGHLRRWGNQAVRFTRLGYDVLMPDPRGYGKSRGPRSEAALVADALAWYDTLANEVGEAPIVVYGRSLGSAMATPVAAARAPRCLLLETPFADLFDVVRFHLPWLPYRLILRYRFSNVTAMRKVRCPVRIFHGMRDAMVPYHSALRLYSVVPATVDREMLTFRKGHHNNLARFARFNREVARMLCGGAAVAHVQDPLPSRPLPHTP